jgi:nucleoside 2-deoxyribosyltransferase
MRVYLAAPYGSRDTIRQYAEQLTYIGFAVTSTWLEETHDITEGTQGAAAELPDAQVDKHARDDIRDIDRSDLLVLFTAASVGIEGGGGRHVETGYALAKVGASSIVVVGEPENVFHRLTAVTRVPDWTECVVHLAHRLVEHERAQPQAMCVG